MVVQAKVPVHFSVHTPREGQEPANAYSAAATRCSKLDQATEQLMSQLTEVRMDEARRLERSADLELEAVRSKLQAMQRGIEVAQQNHADSQMKLKSSTLTQVHQVQATAPRSP